MNALRLEELEQRDLLNAYMAPPPRSAVAAQPAHDPGIERSPAGDFRAMSDQNGQTPVAYADASPSVSDPTPPAHDGGQVVIVERIEIIIVLDVRIEPSHPSTNGDPTNYSNPVNVTADPPARPVEHTPAVNQETPTDASTARVANPAVRAVAPQTTPFAIPPQGGPATALQPVVAQLPFAGGRTGDGMAMAVPVPAAPLNTPAGGAIPAAEPESAEPPLAQPEQPPAAPVLAPLAAIDLSTLGRGLGQFLHQIEKVGEELVGDGNGLRPWLVAAAAAAAACEIARRQLKRAAEYAPIPIYDPRSERPFVG